MANHRWFRILSLLDIFASLFRWLGVLLRIAFPPGEPAHMRGVLDWRLSASRMAEPFKAFLARVRDHACYLGGRFKLLRSPLLAV